MDEAARERWDARYREAPDSAVMPACVLTEYAHLLPATGDALEVACGLGGNALWLAGRGLRVQAWDISPVAIERLSHRAAAEHMAVDVQVRDALAAPPEAGAFDVVVVSRFLERALCPALSAALRPGGLLFYQTYTREAVTDNGPRNPAFRLGPNELLRLFPDLRVLAYREEGRIGDPGQGWRDEALLVAVRADGGHVLE